ncbi:HlyD family secretion protein [Sporocytophaga myxococcoides]|uniref:HlyD family secretion protein n=1 Tax=Sporocytophaga myxococcoides TaxID=153721 RepID=UPI001FE058C1|nr:HlyD family secretion protein [Sporocytophaga myxococcoides]
METTEIVENKSSKKMKVENATNDQVAVKKKNKTFAIILVVLVALGGYYGVSKYVHGQNNEETEDAQVNGNISPVIPRIAGYISSVRIKDNQLVKKGDTLVILDDREMKIKVMQAQAALDNAKSSLSVAHANTSAAAANTVSSQSNISTAEANIEAAKVRLWRAEKDFARYSDLIKDHSITEVQYEQALAEKQTAERQLKILEDQKRSTESQSKAVASQSNATVQQIKVASSVIKQREADLDNALLNLSYTVIVAQADGQVSAINLEPGQLVQAGQQLCNIVVSDKVWVTANFKETQLEKMKIGQSVTVEVDAFPHHKFEAKVASFSPATGSRFALLPPDNASGNFVKVVQRVPVRIELSNNDPMVKDLRPGMNVIAEVHFKE